MFSLSTELLDTQRLCADLQDLSAGALVVFEGRVRNHNESRSVRKLQYQAHPSIALKEGELILSEACHRFDLVQAKCVHRTGLIKVGETAVWVGVIAVHRTPAFTACLSIIDALKERVPIWKKEFYADGSEDWIGVENQEGRSDVDLGAAEGTR